MELRFDAGKLAIDVLRKRQGKPYHEVGIEVGIAPSTIYRAESRLPLSLKSFTMICSWLQESPGNYFNFEKIEKK